MSDEAAQRTAQRRFRLWLLLPLVLFIAVSAMFYERLSGGGDPSAVPSPLLDKPVPQFVLGPVEGLRNGEGPVPGLASKDLVGAVSLVNVWASWCGPCRVEHPLLMALAERGDVRMFGINYKDDPANARRFLGSLGNPFEAVGGDANGRASVDWGVYGVPETFLVDASGCIVFKHVGPLSAPMVVKTLLPAIERAKTSAVECRGP